MHETNYSCASTVNVLFAGKRLKLESSVLGAQSREEEWPERSIYLWYDQFFFFELLTFQSLMSLVSRCSLYPTSSQSTVSCMPVLLATMIYDRGNPEIV